MPRRFPAFLALSPLLACGILVAAQGLRADSASVHDATPVITLGQPSLPLTGPWKFQIGDSPVDPATGKMLWAEPAFDDAKWGAMDLTPPQGSYNPVTGTSGYVPGWGAQGYPKTAGYGWYRLRLDLRDGDSDAPAQLALEIPASFDNAYQVYANGQLIGQFGQFTANSVKFYLSQPRAFLLPGSSAGGPVTLAIRMWMDPSSTLGNPGAGGLHAPPVLGKAPVILAMQILGRKAILRALTSYFVEIVILILALSVALTLYWLDSSEPAYLLLGLNCIALLVLVCNIPVEFATTWTSAGPANFIQNGSYSAIEALWILFWAYWFRLEHRRLLHLVVWPGAMLGALLTIMIWPPFYGSVVPLSAGPLLLQLASVAFGLASLLVLGVAVQGIRKNKVDGAIALPAILMVMLNGSFSILNVLHVPASFHPFGVYIPIGMLATIVSLVMITVLLLRRFFKGRREREQLRREMEQARTVQSVLVPQEVPTVPGFRIQAIYEPAGQVGGDFFQVLPLENGGVLAVIGDVSGKGMPAAMTVSLLVGTVHTLARFTQSPGEILAQMNHRMLARSQGGFTTCLVLRADADGTLTIANAGHIAPYLDGRELDLENGLPLGLAAGAAYVESTFTLAPNYQLTLITDGVLEARSKSGELLGFDRTAGLSTEPAEKVVRTAQAFGQDDDITVVTLSRNDEVAKPVFQAAASALSPTFGRSAL
jgi:hypothetical protein